MKIRPADAGDAEMLSSLALRSKAHWGYSSDFMAACRQELTLTAEEVAAGGTWVADGDHGPMGFYRLCKISPDTLELDALFVAPEYIGHGHGRALMDHALQTFQRAADINRLLIQADPNAARFYEAAGAERIGEQPSASVEGRMLPLYEFDKRTVSQH